MFLARKAREAFTFSDGTTIPKGTFMAVAGAAVHYDANSFDDPTMFNPWRFVPARSDSGKDSAAIPAKDDAAPPTPADITQTSPTHLAFGHGHTACPGRFFAAMQMKMMMAHLVYHYEITFSPGGAPGSTKRPGNKWFAGHCIPDPQAMVYFRRLTDKVTVT